jgi:hypothetical protein
MSDEEPHFPSNVPAGITLLGPDLNADVRMLVAVGAVARASANLELGLRGLCCALHASKYAAVTAAGQNILWLVDNCAAVSAKRIDVPQARRDEIRMILSRCKDSIHERNDIIHGLWAVDGQGAPVVLRSRRGSSDLTKSSVTVERVVAAVGSLAECQRRIHDWIREALGHEAVTLEAQLRWEEYIGLTPPDIAGS